LVLATSEVGNGKRRPGGGGQERKDKGKKKERGGGVLRVWGACFETGNVGRARGGREKKTVQFSKERNKG